MSSEFNFREASAEENKAVHAPSDAANLSNQTWDAAAKASAERKPAVSETSNTWLQIGGLSHHLERDRGFNEQNWGIGIEHKLSKDNPIAIGDDSSIAVGQYRNSIRQTSHYALYQWKPVHVGPLDLGVMVGAVDGYHLNKGGPVPLALPMASLEGKNVGVNFMCVPKLKDVSAVCAAQFKFRY